MTDEKHRVFWKSNYWPEAWTPLRFTRSEFRANYDKWKITVVDTPEFTATAATWKALGYSIPRSNRYRIRERNKGWAVLSKRSAAALERLPRP